MVLFMIAQSQKHIKHNGKNNNNTPQALAITGNNTTGIACFECMLHNIMLSDDGQLSTTIFFKNVYYLQYLAIFKVCIYGKTVGVFSAPFQNSNCEQTPIINRVYLIHSNTLAVKGMCILLFYAKTLYKPGLKLLVSLEFIMSSIERLFSFHF